MPPASCYINKYGACKTEAAKTFASTQPNVSLVRCEAQMTRKDFVLATARGFGIFTDWPQRK